MTKYKISSMPFTEGELWSILSACESQSEAFTDANYHDQELESAIKKLTGIINMLGEADE